MNFSISQFRWILKHFPQDAGDAQARASVALYALHEACEKKMERSNRPGKQLSDDDRVIDAIIGMEALWDAVLIEQRWSCPLVVMSMRLDDDRHLKRLIEESAADPNAKLGENGQIVHLMQLCCQGKALAPRCFAYLCGLAGDKMTAAQWDATGLALSSNKFYQGWLEVFQSGKTKNLLEPRHMLTGLFLDKDISWEEKIAWIGKWSDAGWDINSFGRSGSSHVLTILSDNPLTPVTSSQFYDLLKLGANPSLVSKGMTVKDIIKVRAAKNQFLQLEEAERIFADQKAISGAIEGTAKQMISPESGRRM